MRLRPAPALASVLFTLAALSGCSNSAGPDEPPPGAPDLFDQSVMHSVDITLSAADWAALRANFQANTYYPAEVAIDGETVRNMAVRSRGSGTRNGRKPGLKLDFNRRDSSQRFRGYSSLVLENLYGDLSFLHERLAFAAFESVGLPAPANTFARVRVNGTYWGTYAVVEPVDERFARVRLGDTGGNLYEFEAQAAGNDFAYRGPDQRSYVPVPFSPETNEDNHDASALVAFMRTVSEAPDATFAADLAQFIDTEVLLLHLALEAGMAETDGLTSFFGINNFYLYQNRGTRRFTFVPWDRDYSFGDPAWRVDAGLGRNTLVRRLASDPAQRARYHASLRRVADTCMNGAWLTPRIESAYSLIRQSVYEDPNKRGSENGATQANAEFDAAVQALRHFATVREAALRAQIE
jgi:spore coat protein CotH